MKTKLVLTTLSLSLFLVANSALAQIPYVGQLQYGVKAGINAAWLTEDFPENQPRLGIGAGIAVRYHISPSLAIQGEAQFSQKGEKLEGNIPGFGVVEEIQLDYIEIPVLARYAVPLSPLMTAGVFAGPSVGFPINSKLKTDNDSFDIDNASTDFGLNVGVDIGSGPFSVDGRFNFGLTDIADDFDGKNQNVQFTFGYWF